MCICQRHHRRSGTRRAVDGRRRSHWCDSICVSLGVSICIHRHEHADLYTRYVYMCIFQRSHRRFDGLWTTDVNRISEYIYILVCIDTCTCIHEHADFDRWIDVSVYMLAAPPALRHSTGFGRPTSIALVNICIYIYTYIYMYIYIYIYMHLALCAQKTIHVDMIMQI